MTKIKKKTKKKILNYLANERRHTTRKRHEHILVAVFRLYNITACVWNSTSVKSHFLNIYRAQDFCLRSLSVAATSAKFISKFAMPKRPIRLQIFSINSFNWVICLKWKQKWPNNRKIYAQTLWAVQWMIAISSKCIIFFPSISSPFSPPSLAFSHSFARSSPFFLASRNVKTDQLSPNGNKSKCAQEMRRNTDFYDFLMVLHISLFRLNTNHYQIARHLRRLLNSPTSLNFNYYYCSGSPKIFRFFFVYFLTVSVIFSVNFRVGWCMCAGAS